MTAERTSGRLLPMRYQSITSIFSGALLVLTLIGCASRQAELEKVAKDWCQTIRASQVVPVYPLTADLVPGDLFLVEETVSRQHEAFQDRGFLALPFRIGRLQASGWHENYSNVNDVLISPGMPGSINANRNKAQYPEPLEPAPIAAFPSYSFSVNNGGSFDLAIPVSGVPVGISALGASSATGTVSIKDVRTYGLDAVSLSRDLRDWVTDNEINEFLRTARRVAIENNKAATVYIRVVSRVYVAREFDIAIQSRESRSFGASAGVSSPTSLVTKSASAATPDSATIQDYADNLRILNESLEQNVTALNGGAVLGADARFVAASARSVALKERFAEPLVIGYIGFDMAVLEDGSVGPPIPTFTVLDKNKRPPDNIRWAGAFTECEDRYAFVWSVARTVERRSDILQSAAERLGGKAFDSYRQAIASGETVSEAWNAAARIVLPPELTDEYERERRWCYLADTLEWAVSENIE